MTKDIVQVVEPRAEELPREDDPAAPKVGRWYWVKDTDRETDEPTRWFGCVTYVGSNYARLTSVHGGSVRVHLNEFWDECEFIENAQSIIKGNIAQMQGQVYELMAKVNEITARLAITAGPALHSGSETQALALRTDQPMDQYKTALIKAKEETLPELFKQIERANSSLSTWMSAELIPLKAQAEAMRPAISAIEDRIFSVELYAGLVESVEQIADGDPAPVAEKIRLIQRRGYMDEECLAQYEVGGMDYKNIRDFDRWLCRPSNRDRLLPFPRCIMAFQVRRNRKARTFENILGLFEAIEQEKCDKWTFIYIRNGDKVYRLDTGIEFDQKLFPDVDHQKLDGKLWAKVGHGHVDELVTDAQYQGKVEDLQRKQREYDAAPEDEKWHHRVWSDDLDGYHLFSPDSVYYDDIAKHIQGEITKHNRLVLVLQGLLDRSPVMHPHPVWILWTAEGFGQALELVYDDSRALTTGDKPDFEAYRARLNALIQPGSVTIGQELAWERSEARKEHDRLMRSNRYSGKGYYPERYRPSGNPGPGKFARVVRVGKKSETCTYEWARKRTRDGWDNDAPNDIKCGFTARMKALFNVDAYKPGDFRQFFSDPRTRAEYLKWAPLLIEAEEYHAGNREVPEVKPLPKRHKTEDGSQKYRRRKQLKAFVGKAVRLRRDVEMRSGKTYKKGSLWRVEFNRGEDFSVCGIGPDGKPDSGGTPEDYRGINNLKHYDFEVDLLIPEDPRYAPEKRTKKKPEPEDEDE